MRNMPNATNWSPAEMSQIDQQLAKALPNLPKKLGKAARYALDHPDRIAFDSMRTVATACDVASPTMLRLARALDYESYEAFRSEFQQRFVNQGFGNRADALQSGVGSSQDDHFSNDIAQAATRNIAQTMKLLDIAAVEEFARCVQNSNRTFILGSGSMHWMAALMESTGQMAIPGLRTDHSGSATMVETIASIAEQDTALVMAFAPYARETVVAAAYASKRKAKVFALTDKASSPLVEHADHVFFAPTTSPHYYPSVVSTIVMIEILLSATVATSNAIERIKLTENIRNQSGAYL
ncbi:MurR/RpiR family transcriptional regulator (plasmid) [Parasedimentitalea marina]|uniref:MurR/RpiR family transcriptional regulator n=2 Tax=Parasedimentitalea marina TaxID=2483033 RepID=A0A3T0NAA1_9RHOB|nr:MurR/RpiR family transcriptional regulator [Parasedimentitalea marina]